MQLFLLKEKNMKLYTKQYSIKSERFYDIVNQHKYTLEVSVYFWNNNRLIPSIKPSLAEAELATFHCFRCDKNHESWFHLSVSDWLYIFPLTYVLPTVKVFQLYQSKCRQIKMYTNVHVQSTPTVIWNCIIFHTDFDAIVSFSSCI